MDRRRVMPPPPIAGKELAHISDLSFDDEDRPKVLGVLWKRLEEKSDKNYWRLKKSVRSGSPQLFSAAPAASSLP